ncbi:MAG: TIGR00296 family protein [Candidatus Thermoplasmatota archaeon]|nr:TIGR00296 family protein [Candidatus Thermoplasmatota archaeon]
MYSLEEGTAAVRIARSAIERQLGIEGPAPPVAPAPFKEKSGVFVTLNTHPGRDLRGCIGYAEPIIPLRDAIVEMAKAAATKDPRFPRVRPEEMGRICVDVTILTPPVQISYGDVDDLVSQVRIGRDGLIASRGPYGGLLLPQVPVEYGWGVEEFLSHTCMKGGMHPEEWRRGTVDFKRFSGQVFGERSPGGTIEEMPLA